MTVGLVYIGSKSVNDFQYIVIKVPDYSYLKDLINIQVLTIGIRAYGFNRLREAEDWWCLFED